MKRIIYLAAAVLVALLILVPTAVAQDPYAPPPDYAPLPASGGASLQSVFLPAAALLVGSGILAYAILRRR